MYDNFKKILADRESRGNYNAVFPAGSTCSTATALGKYQFTPGHIKYLAGLNKVVPPSNCEFLSNPYVQEVYMEYQVRFLDNYLNTNGLYKFVGNNITSKNTGSSSRITKEGLMAGAHLGGVTGLRNLLLNNIDGKDSNGTYISEYVQHFSALTQSLASFATILFPLLAIGFLK